MFWWAVLNEEFAEGVQDIAGVELALDTYGETLTCEFVAHAEHAEELIVTCSVLNKIV